MHIIDVCVGHMCYMDASRPLMQVPKMDIDAAFEAKDELSTAISDELLGGHFHSAIGLCHRCEDTSQQSFLTGGTAKQILFLEILD